MKRLRIRYLEEKLIFRIFHCFISTIIFIYQFENFFDEEKNLINSNKVG